MNLITFLQLLVVLGGGQLLLPRGRGAGWAALGLIAFGLGTASFVVGAGSELSLSLATAADLVASPSFLIGSTALLVLGPVAGLAGAALSWRLRPTAVAFAALLDVGVLLSLIPLALEVGIVNVVGTALLLVMAVAVVLVLGKVSRIGTVVRYLDRHVFARWRWRDGMAVPERADLPWFALCLAGVIMVMSRSPMMVTVAGALSAAAGTYVLAMRLAGGPRIPVLLVMVAALIPYAATLHYLAQGGWALTDLHRVPFTTDLEIRLLPLVAVAAFGLAALWPVHGLIPRGILAPIGGVVLIRLGAELLPAGLYVWQPVLSPIALLSVWWGALTGRRGLVVVGWAFQALVTGLPDARPGALGLLWVALGLGLLGAVPERHRSVVTRVLVVIAAGGIMWTLPAMLQTQLIYTILALGGVGVALWQTALFSRAEAQ